MSSLNVTNDLGYSWLLADFQSLGVGIIYVDFHILEKISYCIFERPEGTLQRSRFPPKQPHNFFLNSQNRLVFPISVTSYDIVKAWVLSRVSVQRADCPPESPKF